MTEFQRGAGAALRGAIRRVQKLHDTAVHDQLHWYVFDLMGEGLSGDETTEELQAIFEADDWNTYRGYEAPEIYQGWEGEISAYSRVLDILQLLERGIDPAQGR